ncbi:MAG: hypothetical protein U5K71_06140 [Gracilimonas sp.]|nr:hypothetical protein [Gracilimonas sp.]
MKLDVNFKGMQVDNQFGNQGAIGSAVIFDPTAAGETWWSTL